jgi:hypothetical protein
MLMINMGSCSSSTAKPAATPSTLDLLESALDEIASINANDEGRGHAVKGRQRKKRKKATYLPTYFF